MYKVTGSGSIKGIRFRKGGGVDVLVVPKTRSKPKKRKRNAGPHSFRKTKKLLGKHGYKTKSSQRRKYAMRAGTAGSGAARVLVDHYRKKNKKKK